MVFLEQFNHFLLFLKIVPANVFFFFLRLIFQYLGVIVDRYSPVQEQTQTSAVSAASERWGRRQWAACGLCALTIWPHCPNGRTGKLGSCILWQNELWNRKNYFIYRKTDVFLIKHLLTLDSPHSYTHLQASCAKASKNGYRANWRIAVRTLLAAMEHLQGVTVLKLWTESNIHD